MATTLKSSQHVTTIRIDDDYTRMVIDRAALLLNQTRTSFLLSVARQRAEEVIKEREKTMDEIGVILLSPKASLDIATTLLKEPKPNEAMQKLMKGSKK